MTYGDFGVDGGDLQRLFEVFIPGMSGALDRTSRTLRAAGLMPLGGRGRSAAKLSGQHVWNMLIGLCAPTTAKAAEFVIAWNSTPPANGESSGFAGAEDLGEAGGLVLDDPEDRFGVASVAINCDWPAAEIKLDDGRAFHFGSAEDAQQRGYATAGAHRVFVISGSILNQLAIAIIEDSESGGGWVGDENDPGPKIKAAREGES